MTDISKFLAKMFKHPNGLTCMRKLLWILLYKLQAISTSILKFTADCDYSLDNIVLEKWEIDDNWDNDIDEKIDHLRKKDVHFNFVDIDATGLVVSFEQLNHGFPFGHAVISQTISDCHLDGTDNEYCQHVKDNYNWVVDSYRCSNVAFEICFKTS